MKTIHFCQSVRGALRNWKKQSDVKGIYDTKTGRQSTLKEVKEFLMDELAKGHEVIPIGDPCEGFDYKNGCPGHPKEEQGEK